MNESVFFPKGAKSLGIDVVGCGTGFKIPPEWKPQYRLFDCYVLSFIAKGTAWYESAAAKRTFMPEGSCVIIFPGVSSLYSPCDNSKWKEFWLHFDGPVMRLFEQEGLFKPNKPVIHLRKNNILLGLFKETVKIAIDRSEESQKRLSGKVLNILNEIQCLRISSDGKERSNTPIQSCAKLIRISPEKEWNINRIASGLGLSHLTFIKKFQKEIGQPPHRFINTERMKRACQHLAEGLSVQETCYKIGMEDPYHFSRLFKQIMGKAPLYYQSLSKEASSNITSKKPQRISHLLREKQHPTQLQ
ncbi:MAG: AraC family transcriptional regulator [Fibrobacteres bacterium]|nr:AraC family transcriptional regulator [Fibrobacterota bacterium]